MSVVQDVALVFRPMTEADLTAVMAIEQRAYPFPWTVGNFTDSLHSGYRLHVLEEAGQLIGYCVVIVTLDEAQLLNITVAVEQQGRGLGTQLFDLMADDARSHRARRLFLEVRPSNLAARALYQRKGLIEIGRRKGYYPDVNGREDALVMAREL